MSLNGPVWRRYGQTLVKKGERRDFTFVKFCERRRNATLGIVPKADVQLMQVKTACGQRA
jgi:hypothetical protein